MLLQMYVLYLASVHMASETSLTCSVLLMHDLITSQEAYKARSVSTEQQCKHTRCQELRHLPCWTTSIWDRHTWIILSYPATCSECYTFSNTHDRNWISQFFHSLRIRHGFDRLLVHHSCEVLKASIMCLPLCFRTYSVATLCVP